MTQEEREKNANGHDGPEAIHTFGHFCRSCSFCFLVCLCIYAVTLLYILYSPTCLRHDRLAGQSNCRHDEYHIIQVCVNVSLEGLAGDCHQPSPTLSSMSNHKQQRLLDWNTSRNDPFHTKEQIAACSFSCCCFCHGP